MSKRLFACDTQQIHEQPLRHAIREQLPDAVTQRAVALFKAMGDPTRLRLLWALDRETLCVCDLSALLGMSVSAVSHQLALLRGAGLVTGRRQGKEIFYSLADDHVHGMLSAGMEHAQEA